MIITDASIVIPAVIEPRGPLPRQEGTGAKTAESQKRASGPEEPRPEGKEPDRTRIKDSPTVLIDRFMNRVIQLELDRDLNSVVAKVIDKDSGEVIKQVPPEELVRLFKRMKEFEGLIFNTEV